MRSFFSALSFLTVFPVRSSWVDEKFRARMMVHFPVVGLFLGLTMAALSHGLRWFSSDPLTTSAVSVVALVALTGGLHLDGLADTSDALLSWKNREEMLAIMRDSHIGVMGVLGLFGALCLKIVFLSWVGVPSRPVALVSMCVWSRWALVCAMFFFSYARAEGKAKVFMEGLSRSVFVWTTVVAVAIVTAVGAGRGLVAGGAAALMVAVIGHVVKSRIGGITGDTLGAVCEISEIAVLLAFCAGERIFP
ncbi:MAG TPA: adenosylcobinamide-GDP ribazoletransferase [Elusimicrobiota bacterium]|nr:adenosylcobinamide-GDP ribazoletransferase [Elusimicrobiota bacterium]